MLTCVTKTTFCRLNVILILISLFGTSTAWGQVKRQRAVDRRENRGREKRDREGEQERRFDDPSEEEELNRGLWEFTRGTPYDQILPYVAEEQRKSKATQNDEIELPTGWRLAPAGRQVEVGRLPYEAIPFAGKLVVLDTGYYYKEPQQVSVVDIE